MALSDVLARSLRGQLQSPAHSAMKWDREGPRVQDFESYLSSSFAWKETMAKDMELH